MKNNDNRRSFLKKVAIGSLGVSLIPPSFATAAGSVIAAENNPLFNRNAGDDELSCWLETSLNRVFPQSSAKQATPFDLLAARNSRISFQGCFRNNTIKVKKLECSIKGATELKPMVRLVGLVPMHKFTPLTLPEELDGVGYLPGLIPDPLMPATDVEADPFSSRSFWITLNVPATIEPGKYNLKVEVTWENVFFGLDKGEKGTISLPLTISIAQMVVRPREGFDVIHWWRGYLELL